MFAQHSTKLIVAVAACVVSLGAGGAAVARTPGDPVATSPTAPLYGRVLGLELQGFASTICPVAVSSPGQWAQHSLSADVLRRNGFVNGLREPLRSSRSAARAFSVVAQFDSSEGARGEVDAELQRARSAADAFTLYSVRFQYLLAIDGAGRSEATPLQTRLAAAGVALYRRGEVQ